MNYYDLYGNRNYLMVGLDLNFNLSSLNSFNSSNIYPNSFGYCITTYPKLAKRLTICLNLDFDEQFSTDKLYNFFNSKQEILCSEHNVQGIFLLNHQNGEPTLWNKNDKEYKIHENIINNYSFGSHFWNKIEKVSLDGKLIWESEKVYSTYIKVWDEKSIYFFTSKVEFDHLQQIGLGSISLENGSVNWILEEKAFFTTKKIEDLFSEKIHLHENGILLVQSRSQGILGVKAATGKILWKWKPDLKKIEPIRQKNLAHQNDPKPNVKKMNLNTFSFTIDYDGIVHILNHEFYTQLNSLTGSIINEFEMDPSLIQERPYFKYGYSYYENFIGSEVTVSKTHVIGSNCERIIFINKETGELDKIIAGEDSKHGVIRRILITGENKMITIEDCNSKNLDPYYLKIWKAE